MSNQEKVTFEGLKNNSNIVIKQADKGGGLVIQNREDYLAEAMQLLGDTDERMVGDSIGQYNDTLKELFDVALKVGILNKHECQFLFRPFPLTP